MQAFSLDKRASYVMIFVPSVDKGTHDAILWIGLFHCSRRLK